jgi:hypothetical protein
VENELKSWHHENSLQNKKEYLQSIDIWWWIGTYLATPIRCTVDNETQTIISSSFLLQEAFFRDKGHFFWEAVYSIMEKGISVLQSQTTYVFDISEK